MPGRKGVPWTQRIYCCPSTNSRGGREGIKDVDLEDVGERLDDELEGKRGSARDWRGYSVLQQPLASRSLSVQRS